MGLFFPFFFVVGIAITACVLGRFPAFSVVMALLACFMAGLTASIIGMLVLTNVFKMNYETAFNRSFVAGASMAAVAILFWTALLDLWAGGLTASIVPNLWHVSFRQNSYETFGTFV